MAALIGALRATLSADTADFEQGMRRAKGSAASAQTSIAKSLGGISSGIKGFAAAFSVGLLSSAIKGALDYAGSLGEVAAQLGVTTKELQTFRFAAQQNGASLEGADKALGKLALSMSKALAGSQQSVAAFKAVGVSLEDIRTKSKTQILGQIADEMVRTGGASKNAAAGVAIMGKGFQQLTPLLDQGSAGMNELSRAAEELGMVISDKDIQDADKTADKLDALKTVLSAQIAKTVAQNAGAILSLASSLSVLAAAVVKFMATNPAAALAIAGAVAGSKLGPLGAVAGAFAGGTVGNNLALQQSRQPREDKVLLRYNFRKELARQKAILKAGGSVSVADNQRLVRLTKKVGDAYGYNKPSSALPAGNVGQFLASPKSGGGAKKHTGGGSGDQAAKAAERARLDSIRDAYRNDEDMRRAQMDTLRAQESLSHDFVERSTLQIKMLDLDRAGYQAELANDVAMGDKTKAQADALMAQYDITDSLKRQGVLQDAEEQRQRDYAELSAQDFEIAKDHLQKQSALASTAAERRAIELRILALTYQFEKGRLQELKDQADARKDFVASETARKALVALDQNRKLDQQGVIQSTQGPLEQYRNSLPDTAAKMNEALEGVAVNGLNSLQDGIMSVIDGTKSLKQAFTDMAKSIIADLIRIQIQKMIAGFITSLSGAPAAGAGGGASLPGFATGGSFNVLGKHGRDRNMLQMNGLPIARISRGERISVSNDNNYAASGGSTFHINVAAPNTGNPNRDRQTAMQQAAMIKGAINRSTAKGLA